MERKHAVSRPLSVTFEKLNQMVRGWIQYFKISSIKGFLEEFGQWLRHKVRCIIIKQWKRPMTIYNNLMKLNKACRSNLTDNVKIKFTKMDRLIFTNLDRII